MDAFDDCKLLKRGFISEENKKIIALVLDLFQNSTKLSIGIYDAFGKSIWKGRENASPLCKCLEQYPLTRKLCEQDHLKRTSLEIFEGCNHADLRKCYMGLWNISYPIVKDNIFYGAVLTGQRKFSSEEELSLTNKKFDECLKSLRDKYKIDDPIVNRIFEAFHEVKKVNNFSRETFKNLEDLDRIIVDIITDLLQKETRITLLRHEIHKPNNVVRLTLSEILNDLDELLSSNNTLYKRKINKIKDKILYAKSNSTLFTNIIENIFAPVEKGKKKIIFKRNNIIQMLNDAMRVFFAPAEKKDVIFKEIDCSKLDAYRIDVDRSLIMRVFINAYQNAEKYSFFGENKLKPREIDTICENFKDYFKISISNYGVGILPEERERIWENGYRGILSSDRHRIGSGIGLYQIKEIVEAHKGRAYLESTPKSSDLISGPYLTKLTIELPYYHGDSDEESIVG